MPKPTPKNDFYFTIIEKAAKAGIYVSVEITQEVKDYLVFLGADRPASNCYYLVDNLLGPLQEKNFFHFINSHPEQTNDPPNNWLDLFRVIITLHPEGLLFYYTKSQADLALKKAKSTNIKSWIAIGISAIAAGFTGWPLVSHKNDNTKGTKSQFWQSKQAHQKKQETTLKIPNKDS
jgi:hypothetical protein